jgi:hypothetical protein
MAQIYVSDETKALLEKISKADKRTQDGEIFFLLSDREQALEYLEKATQDMP